MSKYEIGKEFKMLQGMKLPANPKLLPAANALLEKMHGRSDSEVNVHTVQIPGYEGELITIYIMEPKHISGTVPCLIDYHGGGFMMKGSPAHFSRAKEYAYRLKCKVIFPDYRLIPEHPYPVPAEDCYETYKWVIENAEELKIDVNRIAVIGDSAGGNLAMATILMARDRKLPVPCFQILLYPVLDRRMETESMKKYTDTPVWDARLTKLMWELYLGDEAYATPWKPEIAPLRYISPSEAEDLSDMPQTYIETAEFDCLCDEGLAFGGRLMAAGIPVEVHRIEGAVHGYDVLLKSDTVKKLMRRRVTLLKEAFGK